MPDVKASAGEVADWIACVIGSADVQADGGGGAEPARCGLLEDFVGQISTAPKPGCEGIRSRRRMPALRLVIGLSDYVQSDPSRG